MSFVTQEIDRKPEVLTATAKLLAYERLKQVVYHDQLPLHASNDGEHPWDSIEVALAFERVRMACQRLDDRGRLTQGFESHFSPADGMYIDGRIRHDDETERRDGVCSP